MTDETKQKVASAQKSIWSNMTPQQRQLRLNKMRKGRQRAKKQRIPKLTPYSGHAIESALKIKTDELVHGSIPLSTADAPSDKLLDTIAELIVMVARKL